MASARPENERVFEQLLADLREGDLLARLDAAEALGELGDPRAVDDLLAALADVDWYVCAAAVNALGRLGDVRAIEPLIDALTRADVHKDLGRSFAIARVVTNALDNLGEPGFRALIRVLRDFVDDEAISETTAEHLGTLRDPRALDVLLYALTSRTFEVAAAAAHALYELGDPALAPLVGMLRDEHTSHHAQMALIRAGVPGVPLLLEALSNRDSPRMRASAAYALGIIADERAREPLRRALTDEDKTVRLNVSFALGGWHDPAALAPLLDMLDEAHQRWIDEILRAFRNIGDPAVEPLVRALRDKTQSARAHVHAAQVLGELRDERAVDALLDALRDDDATVRAVAAQALGDLGAVDAADALMQLTTDADPSVRLAAYSGLAGLHDPRALPGLLQLAQEDAGIPEANSTHWHLRTRAVLAMTRLGQQAIEPLRHLLASDDRSISYSAGAVLTMLGDDGRAALRDETRNPRPEVRRAALGFLFRAGNRNTPDPQRRELMLAALVDPDSSTRYVGAQGLRDVATTQDIEPLINALADDNLFIRVEVAGALERVGDERAIMPLFRAYSAMTEADQASMGTRDALMRAVISIKRRQRGADG